MKGSFIDRFTFPPAIELIASGRVDVRPPITPTFKLDEAAQAFDVVARGSGLKVQIRP